MTDEWLCQGRSGKKIRVLDAYCDGCGARFVTFGVHSHDYDDGRVVVQFMPCEVDIHCYRVAMIAECPDCKAEGTILIATEAVS